jgi:hypothetical protein
VDALVRDAYRAHYARAGSGWTHKPLRRPCCWRR